jgi:hypothetical protein
MFLTKLRMTVFLLLPPILGFALLAAHFYRAGIYAGAAASVVLIFLVAVRHPWAARVIQAALLLGSLEWLRSTIELIQMRSAMGAPYLRLAIILGGVCAFTALCALAIRTRTLRSHFKLDPDSRA